MPQPSRIGRLEVGMLAAQVQKEQSWILLLLQMSQMLQMLQLLQGMQSLAAAATDATNTKDLSQGEVG